MLRKAIAHYLTKTLPNNIPNIRKYTIRVHASKYTNDIICTVRKRRKNKKQQKTILYRRITLTNEHITIHDKTTPPKRKNPTVKSTIRSMKNEHWTAPIDIYYADPEFLQKLLNIITADIPHQVF